MPETINLILTLEELEMSLEELAGKAADDN
jgi:hypothetical protein